MRSRPRRFALIAALAVAAPAAAQLRVVSYNTLDKPVSSTDLSLARTIFDAIATTPRNGIAKRPDIIGLQEQRTLALGVSAATQLADELNDLYGVDTYEGIKFGSGNDLLAAVYDSATVSLASTFQVFSQGPRAAPRLEFQPVGYSSADAALHQYVAHFKAGTSSSDRSTREDEGTRVRNNADGLGAGANVIYSGDLNLYSPSEPAYQALTASGVAQAHDPLDLPSWPGSFVAEHLTQSTRTSFLSDGGSTGGMDDRFDWQLVTSGLLDGEGLSYLGPTSAGLSGLEHSYQAFGNDGNTYNQSLISNLNGRSQPFAVLNALYNFSDHLPVVADYQLPAVMGVDVGSIPLTLELGKAFSLDVAVSNDAAVVASVGADELDYALTTTGDLVGAFSGALAALAGDVVHQIVLDTSTLGVRNGMLTIASSSQAVENGFFQVPINYEVVTPTLAGDYNDDGLVDAADYVLWRNGSPLANETVTPGENTPQDLLAWRDNYGAVSGDATSVPEPSAATMLLAAALLAAYGAPTVTSSRCTESSSLGPISGR